MDVVNSSLANFTLSSWEINEKECRQLLSDQQNWNMIPSLNSVPLHNVADQQLVRFVGMIQDVPNPEMFLEKYEMQNTNSKQTRVGCGKYRDVAVCGPDEVLMEDSPNNLNKERQLLCCISIPALNNWVKQYGRSQSIQPSCKAVNRLNKRAHPGESDDSNDDCNRATTSTSLPDVKRLCPTFQQVADNPKHNLELNLPLPDKQAVACVVKVYDRDSSLSVNSMIDVIGFLSVDPPTEVDAFSSNEEMEMEDLEMRFRNLPGSLMPRIHAVAVQKLRHCNPLLPPVLSNTDDIMSIASSAREELHLVLSQILLGDSLAADYLICHLISTVFLRSNLKSLGQYSLNVTNVPVGDGYCEKVYAVLERLLTKSHYLPLTLDNLNKCTFIPKKDYEEDRLLSGILQLSARTHLVLDETCLQPGLLDVNGVRNIAALGTLITEQKVDYEFDYYKIAFRTDVPVLVLSEGKSILPSDVALPLDPDKQCLETRNAIFEAAGHYLQEPVLERLRKYLTAMSLLEYSLPENIQPVIQDDFVNVRRERGSKFSAADLDRLLVLARLICLSRAEQTLSKECWELARNMEKQRKQRIRS